MIFVPVFLLVGTCAFLLVPFLGQNFFPASDTGSFLLHLRAKSGTRIEETARLCDLVEQNIRTKVPAGEVDNILDNIGLPYSTINLQHATSGLIGAGDADILVSLKEDHRPTAEYVARLRQSLPRDFPGIVFYFLPSDIVTQILNFGLPAPIDIQYREARHHRDAERSRIRCSDSFAMFRASSICAFSSRMTTRFSTSDVDRTKAAQGGYSLRDVGGSLQNLLSGSSQLNPISSSTTRTASTTTWSRRRRSTTSNR